MRYRYLLFAFLMFLHTSAQGYVEAPLSLGAVVAQSTHIMLVRVEAVDREKNLIIYRKVLDIKNKHPQEIIKHNIGRGGLRPGEWKVQMDWAEPGKHAMFFHNGGASEMFIGNWWYQAYPGGEWWNCSHGEPFLLRSYAGTPEKLVPILMDMLAGKEVVVPCMVDGNKEDLHARRAKIQRMKASLKIQDYNPKRDFVGWGGEDFRRIHGMPAFTHYSGLPRIDEGQAISFVDFNGDGKTDVCLIGGGKLSVQQNGGEALAEMPLPGVLGARAAVWADYNLDGKPDLYVASTQGPKLFTNLGDRFRDDTHLLPKEPFYHLTAAAWIDYDGDGRPDLLTANGYQGLKLYKNVGVPAPQQPQQPKMGGWNILGPFDNTNNVGFTKEMPFEKDVDLKATWEGKGGQKVAWKAVDFPDAVVHNFHPHFPKNPEWSGVYLYRDIDAPVAVDLPASFGSDDTLTVWLNGQKIVASAEHRGAAPDQNLATLKLKQGKNQLLLKINNGGGDWGFYFNTGKLEPSIPQGLGFVDVSSEAGLGEGSPTANMKGDSLTVADFTGDGLADILFGAGQGVLLRANKASGKVVFEPIKDSGLAFQSARVGPVVGDFNRDGTLDVLIPQRSGVKLFQNDGTGKFTDVTSKSGDLAKNLGMVTCATWGDFDNDGQLDLMLGCLKGPNRFLRNLGNGAFEDASEKAGLTSRIFNTQAIGLVDLNGDGMLDLVLANEGQESAVMLGNPGFAGKLTPVTFTLNGKDSAVGSRVWVTSKDGKTIATSQVAGGEGRGGQSGPIARFALAPGAYDIHVRYSNQQTRVKAVTVSESPMRGILE